MQLDKLAGDRQSESRAVMGARRRRVDLRELAEDQIVMFGSDAYAGVTDFHDELHPGAPALGALRFEPHASPGWREVDGIAEEIPDNVGHLLAVGVNSRKRRVDVDPELQLLAGEERLVEGAHLLQHLAD